MYMRVEVGFPGHEKAVSAGGDAIWMWLAMKAYAKIQGSGGRVPGCMIGRLQGPDPSRQRRLVARLVASRLVDEVGQDYQLHDYTDWEESAEQAAERRAASRRRKAEWDKRNRGAACGNGVTDEVSNAVGNGVTEKPVTPDGNDPREGKGRVVEGREGEDPPTPLPEERRTKPRDPLAYLSGGSPQQRPDVVRVFSAFVSAVGQPERRMKRAGYECADANCLVEALDSYGEPDCLLVAKWAPRDGMVNGTDDEQRKAHDSVRYVFGNPDTFARILHAARNGEQRTSRHRGKSIDQITREAKVDPVEAEAAAGRSS